MDGPSPPSLTPLVYGIGNTTAWTRDGRFLVADTLRNEIYAYDRSDVALVNKRVFASIPKKARYSPLTSVRCGCLEHRFG
jgi:sugar lactone lactonase YvrE